MLSRFYSGIWKLAPWLVAVFAFHVNSIQAQERIAPKPNVSKSEDGSPTSGATTVTALKPNFTRKEATPVAKGITEVPLASRLEGIFSGGEPRSVQDLLALQEQQAKVVGKIQAVTVHVEQGAAQGSGVIITPDGYVLTAAHVAGKPNLDVWIRVPGIDKKVRGKTMGMNRNMDAGLVKITESRTIKETIDGRVVETVASWPFASLGTSSQIKPGNWVIASGHSGGWNRDGRPAVIRVGRVIETMPSTLVTDCALIGGDSGGPLFDLKGKLIGIHSRIGTDVSDNMHVPIDVFADNWDRMARSEAWGTLPGYKPVIGVRGSQTDSRAIVSEVVDRSPAFDAGLRVGDVIRKFDSAPIKSFQELIQAVDASLPGDRVRLEVERDGKIIEISVVIGVQES